MSAAALSPFDMLSSTSSAATMATPSPFPAPSRTATAAIPSTNSNDDKISTTATRISFADKILITITQSDLSPSHWLHVSLLGDNPLTDPSTYLHPTSEHEQQEPDVSSLLPFPHLTATTVLGGTKPSFEILGQTLATTLASALLMKSPAETRMLVFGLGLSKDSMAREEYEGVVGLGLDVL
ncbi:hypothetical protein AAFC00_000415 [Neodothiora populina]|uniref:Proteasome assembly chaperone 3 n=1 Tax=Neodothiora populina TaxID=2781224 RepID=A0ABR3PDD0_9PEZI